MDALSMWLSLLVAVVLLASCAWAQPANDGMLPSDAGRLLTRWGAEVTPEDAHREYPRPQLVREKWLNLNGLWGYALRPLNEGPPEGFDGQILVPFPIESYLSGVMQRVGDDQALWYRRTFTIPSDWQDQRVLLHFGAVDWQAEVWVNGRHVGMHRGGYDPFTFDITDALNPRAAEQTLQVRVIDPTDGGSQARGKQVREPKGIWYTPTTGIWQTVWLEPVQVSRISSLRLTGEFEPTTSLRIDVSTANLRAGDRIEAVLREGADVVCRTSDVVQAENQSTVRLPLPDARLWSPDDPYLYDLTIRVKRRGQLLDEVDSYFGFRYVDVRPDEEGITRIHLNGEPLFMFGPLDQGFWPDGLYAAPSDEALRYDIEVTRQLGFNAARKHVKMEPARWYYWCDRLGLMVWQDMPNGGPYQRRVDDEMQIIQSAAKQFETEWKALMDAHMNHPSIVMWVVFNEGWGQYDTERMTEWTKSYDPTRLVNNASGWTDMKVGDVHDIHAYPGPACPPTEPNRAAVLGEFGGLGLAVSGHTWQDEANWGYRQFIDADALTDAYVKLIGQLRWMIGDPGLSAAIYTQTTDVEIEVNGLMTYDRAMIKMDAERVAQANQKVYLPPPVMTTLVPTARDEEITWRYTTQQPPSVWNKKGFDDSAWSSGTAGFGTKGTPGAVVGTEWSGEDIWIRREFDWSADVDRDTVQLLLHHDEDAEVYINGVLAAEVSGYTVSYQLTPILPPALQALRTGQNSLAIHCRQTRGGQFIDAGIVCIEEADEIP